jgi:RNA polymerase sigma-70 factor, ECF subfamily
MEMDQAMPGQFVRWVAATPDWDAIYRTELPRVYNFLRYRLGNIPEIEDLTAHTFEKAWRARDQYRRDIAGFATWLFSIARNVANDHVRSRRNHVSLDDAAEVVSAVVTPEDNMVRQSNAQRLELLLATLSERDRELIALKYGAEMTNRAIARATGLSETNIGTILHRTMQTLRESW